MTSWYECFQDALQDANDAEGFGVSIRSYSGRGMYGESCLGVSGDPVDVQACIGAAMANLVDGYDFPDSEKVNMILDIWDFKADGMGRGMIFYWIDLPFKE